MTVQELRRKYLEFFESKEHMIHASGSLVPVDVTGRLDESLLFNGAGMVQFKPYFRGAATPPNPRLVTSQKCLRTGDIEEVGDDSHLTFFEMLGNFSFGDYFKKDAIAMSWEFLTDKKWLGLDPKRLSFTVFEEDDEAFTEWSKHLESAGLDATNRVFRLSEKTNYWPAGAFSSGPPGPCGPNSEMFYWTSDTPPPSGEYSREDYLRDEAEGKWLEIWNDVFIQYEWQGELNDPSRPDRGYRKTGMPNLPFQSVDTGMGIERTVTVLNGFKDVYSISIFQDIFRELESLKPGLKYGSDEAVTRAMRVIADHLRGAVFCIGDGILPSNTGRGYVLRRLIRRAIVKGARTLGFESHFMAKVAERVIALFGDHYVELVDRKATILATLENEEAQFRRTLEQGFTILEKELNQWKQGQRGKNEPLGGATAFALYDTYGFPLEVTIEASDEAGVAVDTEGFRTEMQAAQDRSRAASGMDTVYGGVGTIQIVVMQDDGKPTPTEFLGYTMNQASVTCVGALPVIDECGRPAPGQAVIALDRTPFYAESGGQTSDTGELSSDDLTLRVVDVTKQDGVFIHLVEGDALTSLAGKEGEEAQKATLDLLFQHQFVAKVDAHRRLEITRNHTATHLLHAALRERLGEHVTQAGSFVGQDQLRFDFTHGAAMTSEELADVERRVNEEAIRALGMVTYEDVPLEEARAMGAMALFGEKYADRVRVVQVGEMSPDEPSFSRELCGGIHVHNTGEIGLIKIVHEASAASGVRRISAITGEGAYRWLCDQEKMLHSASALLKAQPRELVSAIEKNIEALKEEKRKREKMAQQGGAGDVSEVVIGPVVLKIESLEDADAAHTKLVADRLVDNAPNAVALVSNIADGKVTFACKVGADAMSAGAKAGDLVREVAKITGGGGGGRPEFATAGGRDASKVPDALKAAEGVVRQMVGA
ncbi:MAG: alanine--tRNA ligase [Armatimonadetes bacterium]|nr:alanine--tRNA ligase [Armatimonadota bacterium]